MEMELESLLEVVNLFHLLVPPPRHPCFLKTSSEGLFPVEDTHLPQGPGLIGNGGRCGEPCIPSPYVFGFFLFYQECLCLFSNFLSPQRPVFLQAHCATSLICCRIWSLGPGWHISQLKPSSSLWSSSLGSQPLFPPSPPPRSPDPGWWKVARLCNLGYGSCFLQCLTL